MKSYKTRHPSKSKPSTIQYITNTCDKLSESTRKFSSPQYTSPNTLLTTYGVGNLGVVAHETGVTLQIVAIKVHQALQHAETHM